MGVNVEVSAFWEKWDDMDIDLMSWRRGPGVRSVARAAPPPGAGVFAALTPAKKTWAWSLPGEGSGLGDRDQQGRPGLGEVGWDGTKVGDRGAGLTGAGPLRARGPGLVPGAPLSKGLQEGETGEPWVRRAFGDPVVGPPERGRSSS